jgi:hypothetical protein
VSDHPADLVNPSEPGHSGGLTGGAGVGFGSSGPNRRKSFENWHSYEWAGDTVIEHSKWTLRELDLVFERRFAFFEDGSELRIADRIIDPKGDTERELSIRTR